MTDNRVFYTQVHGILHENSDGSHRQRIIRKCRKGEELDLVPEPTNPYDAGAVKICRKDGQQLGHWQADGRMAHDLSIGWTYKIIIDEIYSFPMEHRKSAGLGVKLRIEVLTMSHATEAWKHKAATAEPIRAAYTPAMSSKPKSWIRSIFGL